MHLLFSITAFLALELASSQDCVDVQDDAQHDYKVVGGYVIDIENAPFMVSWQYDLGSGLKHSCGGSLISEKFVLSAAHCKFFVADKLCYCIDISSTFLGFQVF